MCLLAAVVGSANAQQVVPTKQRLEVTDLKKKPGTPAMPKGACIYSEDFEGGSIPAGWDIGPQVETQDDNTGVGTGTFVDAWNVDNAANADNGGFFGVPDVPAGNLFAYANDDGDPCNCGMDDIGLVTSAIDLSSVTAVGVTFRIWHDGQYTASTCKVQVSTDGGFNFTDLYTVAESPNWQNVALSLTPYVGNSDVRLRFQWDDGTGAAWGTGIAVDDICVAPLPDNDLALARAFMVGTPGNYDDPTVRNLECSIIPLEQAIELTVAADVVNNGGATQTNLVLSAEVFVDGTSQGVFTSSTPYPSLDPAQRDTLTLATGWTPSGPGDVTVTVNVVADATDANPADNNGNGKFTVSDDPAAELYSQWAVDTGAIDGYIELSTASGTAYSLAGTKFQVENAGSVAYGVGVVFFENTDPGALINVYFSDDAADVGTVQAFEIQPWHLSAAGEANVIFIPFDEPTPPTLDPTMDYTVLIENAGVDIASIGLSGDVNPGGLWAYDNDAATLYQYIGWGNPAPMVRLFLAEAPSSVSELNSNGVTLGVCVPNPANDLTIIPYELSEARTVSLTVTDVTGKLVFEQNLGRKPAGKHQFNFDASALADGTYSYTLAADDLRLTRPMMVMR